MGNSQRQPPSDYVQPPNARQRRGSQTTGDRRDTHRLSAAIISILDLPTCARDRPRLLRTTVSTELHILRLWFLPGPCKPVPAKVDGLYVDHSLNANFARRMTSQCGKTTLSQRAERRGYHSSLHKRSTKYQSRRKNLRTIWFAVQSTLPFEYLVFLLHRPVFVFTRACQVGSNLSHPRGSRLCTCNGFVASSTLVV